MKSWVTRLGLIIMVLFAAGCTKQNEVKDIRAGIVTAKKLVCRESPDAASSKITMYNFATPLVLVNKSSSKSMINGISDYWYQEKETSGWVFGGYLLVTDVKGGKFYRFTAERIQCNYPCGGLSCAEKFEPRLVGNYFITYTYLSDYPEDNEPYAGIVIGEYSRDGEDYNFLNVKYMSGYFENGEIFSDAGKMENYMKMEKERYRGHKMVFKKVNDGSGEYYIRKDEEKVLDRRELKARCKDERFREAVWYDSYSISEIKIEDCLNIVPGNFRIK